MVECFLAKEDVAGSTPVSRSNKTPKCDTLLLGCCLFAAPGRVVRSGYSIAETQGRGTQVVRERSANTFMRRFDPDPRLQFQLYFHDLLAEAKTI